MTCDTGSEEQKYCSGLTLSLQQHEKMRLKQYVSLPCIMYHSTPGIMTIPNVAVDRKGTKFYRQQTNPLIHSLTSIHGVTT